MSRTHETIALTYGALPHFDRDGAQDGWIPFATKNGARFGRQWFPHGGDLDDAIDVAHTWAQEESERYIGDFLITIEWVSE
jgi:hypothetical protein